MFSQKDNRMILNSFSFLLFLSLFHNTSIRILSDIGFAAILAMLGISFILLAFKAYKNISYLWGNMKVLIICASIIVLLSFIGIFINFTQTAISVFFETSLLLSFFFLFSYLKYDKQNFNYHIMGICLGVIIVILYLGLIGDFKEAGGYHSIYDNTNAFGLRAYFFCLLSVLLYVLSKYKYFLIYTAFFLILIYLSNARVCILNILIAIFLLLIYKWISKNKFMWYSLLGLLFLGTIVLTIIYPYLINFEYWINIDNKMVEMTGKSFFSGRQLLWSRSIDAIFERPLLGYGTGKELRKLIYMEELGYYKTNLTHNTYLQLMIENGIVSLGAFIIFAINIWKRFYLYRDNAIIKFVFVFFITILIQAIFEVALLQSNMLVGILQWFILAVGVSIATKQIEK